MLKASDHVTSASYLRSDACANDAVTRELEHAVSTFCTGPTVPNLMATWQHVGIPPRKVVRAKTSGLTIGPAPSTRPLNGLNSWPMSAMYKAMFAPWSDSCEWPAK